MYKEDWLSRLEDVVPKLRILMALALITVSLLALGVDFFTGKEAIGNSASDYPVKSGFEIP
jgi:hypothetical protein